MPRSGDYLDYVVDQLRCMEGVTSKKMFGGAGIYRKGIFFALIADDVLYFKTDDSNRPDYEAEGMSPFKPFRGKSCTSQYYEVPVDILEDKTKLKIWMTKAFSAALKANVAKKRKLKKKIILSLAIL